MSNTPFTLSKANDVAEDFEDLADTDFRAQNGKVYVIESVLVAPYHEEDKLQFTDNYLKCRNGSEAISFYAGSDYDVVIFFFEEADESALFSQDIRAFVAERGITYNFNKAEH